MERNAPNKLIRALEAYSDFSIVKNIEKIIVAGGFIRAYYAGENPSDLDLYFRNNADLISVKSELEDKKWNIVFKTDKAITFKKDTKIIQLISYIYGEPSEVLQLFDFTICCASMTITRHEVAEECASGNNEKASTKLQGQLLMHDDFFEHLSGRVLTFIGTPLPISSLARAFKFVKRGYRICDENIVSIAEAISRQVDFDDTNKLNGHLASIDTNRRSIQEISTTRFD